MFEKVVDKWRRGAVILCLLMLGGCIPSVAPLKTYSHCDWSTDEICHKNPLDQKSIKEILAVIDQNSDVNLSGMDLTMEMENNLVSRLKSRSPLIRLNLAASINNSTFAQKIGEALKQNRSLEELNLSMNMGLLSDIDFENFLEKNESIHRLVIRGNEYRGLGTKPLNAIAQGLKKSKSLMYLDLSYNAFDTNTLFSFGEALKENTVLESLAIKFNEVGPMTDINACLFGSVLGENRLSKLNTLDLSEHQITNLGFICLAKGLKANETIKSLNLSVKTYVVRSNTGEKRASNEWLIAFSNALKRNSSLQEFRFGMSHRTADLLFSLEGAHALAEALKINRSLKKLSIPHSYASSATTVVLASGIRENTSLTELDLSSSRMGNDGAEAIADAVKEHPTLQKLDVATSYINLRGLKAIDRVNKKLEVNTEGNFTGTNPVCGLSKVNTKKQTIAPGCGKLKLSWDEPTSEVMILVSSMLERNKGITELSISGSLGLGCCRSILGDVGLMKLTEGLRKNTQLKELELKENAIGPLSWLFFFQSLEHNTTLELLNLNDNKLNDLLLISLAKSLNKNTKLTEILLSDTGIGAGRNKIAAPGVAALFKLLIHNKSIQKISLNDNDLGDSDMLKIAQTVRENNELREIHVYDNYYFSDLAAVAIAQALQYNKSLVRMDILQGFSRGRNLDSIGAIGAIAFVRTLEYKKNLQRTQMIYLNKIRKFWPELETFFIEGLNGSVEEFSL